MYCQQLRCLADAIQEKRRIGSREVMLLHDNARPHSDNLTNTIQELDWEVIPQPPYLPDLTPSDFHLFSLSVSNNLEGTSFPAENVLRTWLDNFFNSKPCDLYRCRIEKLLQRWQTVVNSEGEHTVDD